MDTGRRAERGDVVKSRRLYSLGRARAEREGGYITSDEAEGGGSDEGDSGESGGDDASLSASSSGPSIIAPTPPRVRFGTQRGPHRMQRVRCKFKCSLRCKGYYVRLAQHYQSKKHGLAPQAAKQLASNRDLATIKN